MVLDFSAASLALASIFTHVTDLGSMPFALASAGHITRAPSAAGVAIFFPAKSFMPLMPAVVRGGAAFLAGEILDALDARALQPVHALWRVGVHVEHRHRVRAFPAS